MIDRLRKRISTAEREGGFTLIELLVVMIIIAVLIAIAIPSYLGFKDRAERRAAQSNLREAVPTAEAYYQDNTTYVGMDLADLQAIDAGTSPTISVTSATANCYVMQSTVNGKTYYIKGPGGTITDTAPAACA